MLEAKRQEEQNKFNSIDHVYKQIGKMSAFIQKWRAQCSISQKVKIEPRESQTSTIGTSTALSQADLDQNDQYLKVIITDFAPNVNANCLDLSITTFALPDNQ